MSRIISRTNLARLRHGLNKDTKRDLNQRCPPVVGIHGHWPKQQLRSSMMQWSGSAEPELELELTARLI